MVWELSVGCSRVLAGLVRHLGVPGLAYIHGYHIPICIYIGGHGIIGAG